MPVVKRIAAFEREMAEWRHDLHMHPELGFRETRTSAAVQKKLRSFGVDEVLTGLAGTGVVGVIRGREVGRRAIGLRADLDALPIDETTGLPYASRNASVMHACGHDGHTVMLLGAARYLAETRNFGGTVYLIFQPAEEGLGGSAAMVKDGLFDRCPMDLIFGMHNMPQWPAGTFAWRDGAIWAGGANIEITIAGKGGHGALPHLAIDPIVVASHLVCAIQTIVSRKIDPAESGVVTIGEIHGFGATNVIPQTVHMRGTARWYTSAVGEQIEDEVRRLSAGIADCFGAKAGVSFQHVCPPTINDVDATVLTRRAAEAVVGEARVTRMVNPVMAGEDFAFMLKAIKGSYILLGSGQGQNSPALHQPDYDFNDAVLAIGASYWAVLVDQLLPRQA